MSIKLRVSLLSIAYTTQPAVAHERIVSSVKPFDKTSDLINVRISRCVLCPCIFAFTILVSVSSYRINFFFSHLPKFHSSKWWPLEDVDFVTRVSYWPPLQLWCKAEQSKKVNQFFYTLGARLMGEFHYGLKDYVSIHFFFLKKSEKWEK